MICSKCNFEIKEGVSFCGACGAPVKNDSSETKRLKEQFPFFSIGCILYSVFYILCLYKNLSSVAFLVFTLGTIGLYFLFLKKMDIKIKKISYIYYMFMILIGISMFMTDDLFIITFNYLGFIILIIVSMITNYYDDKKWDVGKYIGSFFKVGFGAIGNLYRPFSDLGEYRKQRDKHTSKKTMAVISGLLISVPLLIIIIALLASADAVFGKVFIDIFKDADWVEDPIKIVILFCIVFVLTYGLFAKMSKKDISETGRDLRVREPIQAIMVTGLLSVVYIIFSAIQIIYLFLGKMSLPEGYTYAKYAREGFFQLLFVCLINLFIVLLVTSFFRNNKVLKIILTVISLCTYVMLASSAFRMILYIKTYDLTKLRILVLWALLVMSILLIGLIVRIYRFGFPLFRYSLIIISVLYIGLAFSRPDSYIAKYNLNSAKEFDAMYLAHLSDDAAPAIGEFYEKAVEQKDYSEYKYLGMSGYFSDWECRSDYKNGIRSFNLSRYEYQKISTTVDLGTLETLSEGFYYED